VSSCGWRAEAAGSVRAAEGGGVKLLVTSDWQLGAGVNLGYGEHGPGSRLNDQLVTATRIAELAHAEGVDLVLHAGDVFEHRKPTPAQLDVWAAFLLALEDIPCLAITGNHCRSGTSDVTSLDVFRGYPNFTLSTKPECIRYRGIDGGTVCTLPWAPTSQLVANRNGEREGVNEEAQCSGPNLLLAHWSVSGATLPNGMDASALHEVVLPLDDLKGCRFDGVVLGHLHKPQLLSGHPILYCGSPGVVDFGEADGSHGVWLLDWDERWTANFRRVPDRPFVTLDLDVYGTTDHDTCMVQTGDPDVTDAIEEAVRLYLAHRKVGEDVAIRALARHTTYQESACS
jgi:DNA repair exonuclease SbcCD nuclease subunit